MPERYAHACTRTHTLAMHARAKCTALAMPSPCSRAAPGLHGATPEPSTISQIMVSYPQVQVCVKKFMKVQKSCEKIWKFRKKVVPSRHEIRYNRNQYPHRTARADIRSDGEGGRPGASEERDREQTRQKYQAHKRLKLEPYVAVQLTIQFNDYE